MLAESFISALRYRDRVDDEVPAKPGLRNPPCGHQPHKVNRDSVKLKPLSNGREKVSALHSSAFSIPTAETEKYWSLELYRSWGCASFCKDYPDLQLRGGHVGDSESAGPDYDPFEGPLIQSQDLAEMEPLRLDPVGPRTDADAPQDGGYLEMDDSTPPNMERPSNSMINGYLESKLIEVYRDYLQDSLARCSSYPSCVLPPCPGLPSLQQLSLEQASTRLSTRSLVAHYISSQCTCTASSHFSTPVLRISNTEQKKKPPS